MPPRTESGRGLPQSKTCRIRGGVLECGSPLPLSWDKDVVLRSLKTALHFVETIAGEEETTDVRGKNLTIDRDEAKALLQRRERLRRVLWRRDPHAQDGLKNLRTQVDAGHDQAIVAFERHDRVGVLKELD